MGEKEQQLSYPMAPANDHGRSDTEAGGAAASELHKRKRTQCLIYIGLLAIIQIAVVIVFSLTVMKIRNPRFRIRSAHLTNFNAGTPASPAFTGKLNAEFSVKNANFGRYKYMDTTVDFVYRGTRVGEVFVRESRAGWRTTKKFNVAVDLSLANARANPQLASDLNAGVVPISSEARMSGSVELLFVLKKNRSTGLNCTMEIVTATQQIRNILCK
ncbi:hypothetical protein ABFS82_06G026500 [Erythranthe guttata]|uniref:Uncharacterized protein n=1 Tax=Erythranthe guttata TaxID=4155 RepID=A0A022Q8Z1_ERYGU|nr:PREDICTED: uncharacterized protein LOC105971629 [Erythranthe guttata]EYU25167.1 hypothetical protein MIMGU_mgv1a013636mg [Erythranthe guttata]|eukprot:XP_012851936.1 PREDICTED: uncharacterized protein LOC105971629 [Erythranthe guttata]